MKRAKDSKPAAEPGFDAVLEQLRAVVERLEGGDLPLEAALAAYEEGVGLARRGHGLLDRAEQRVELLSAGSDRPVPMPGTDEDEDEDDDDEDDDA
ncbi:MAG: exodeoxyribonuclease VII small subunit [Kofleriaceae bacterium]